MPTLVACLSSGKGTWTEVILIIQAQPWTSVFLITNTFGQENFRALRENIHLVAVDFTAETPQIAQQIKKQLAGRITDLEIALNFVSGNGKEHMALLEAVLELGLNFRLITTENGQVGTLGLSA